MPLEISHAFTLMSPYTMLRSVPLLLLMGSTTHAQLSNYWPVTEASGTTTLNTVGGGTNGSLFGGASLVTDGIRGQVLEFNGAGSYVDAGTIPALNVASNFTWSFWANSNQGANNNVIVGNRYNSSGGEFSPREFTKFTTSNFEWHVNAGGQNINYPDATIGAWDNYALVKQGSLMMSYRNGLVNGTNVINAGLNNAQPLYFGGNQGSESWSGRLDDVATWTGALPARSVAGIAQGLYTPATAPLTSAPNSSVAATDGFTSLAGWNSTDRGLENNAPAGYNAPTINGSSQLSLSGTTTGQYWFGSSIQSVTAYDSTKPIDVSVDRVSLTGSGSAFRSSLWILGDDGHYLHFSQNMNEGGWSWNARDDGGQGTLGATGAGNNLALLDALDSDGGLHNMKISLEPLATTGQVNMYLYLDGTLVGAQGFSNFPSTFSVALTGQGRAIGDSVNAVFDNLLIQVPEPSTLAALSLLGLGMLRRKRA
jgi:hypothetical protein